MPTSYPSDSRLARELSSAIAASERRIIHRALREHHGDIGATALYLGIHRRTLELRMRDHSLRDDAAAWRTEAGTPGPRSAKSA